MVVITLAERAVVDIVSVFPITLAHTYVELEFRWVINTIDFCTIYHILIAASKGQLALLRQLQLFGLGVVVVGVGLDVFWGAVALLLWNRLRVEEL